MQRNIDYLVPLERDHPAVYALMEQLYGLHAEPRGKDPVVGRRRPSPLQVAEHHEAGLKLEPLFDLVGEKLAYAAEPYMAERVELLFLRYHAGGLRGRAFGRDDYAEVLSGGAPVLDMFADIVDVKRLLRDEDYVRASGEPAVYGYPAGVTDHDRPAT